MLLPAWLILSGAVIVLICLKRYKAFLTRYMRIRTLVNKMPGPPTVPLLGNAYNLQWDAVAFTFQMEYLFRKYAYKTDGVIRFWVGPVPVVFLCRPKTVKTMLHILEKFADRNETVDLLPYLRRFSMDTISETAMGVSVNAQKGENQDFYVSITKIFELLFKNLRYPWLWFKPIWYALGYGFEFDRHVSIVKKLVTKVIAERTREFESLERKPTFEELSAGGKKKLAFLDLLLSMRKEHKLTDMDIAEEVGTFLVAGYDTVSSSIGFVLFLLGQRQHLQDKVYEELNEIFGDSDRAITVDDLKRMKYLEQCMKESIRMYPTVVMIGRRITEDTVVGDYLIPAGVTVSISPFAVARDPEQWKNPEVYDPDRFSPENSAGRDPFSFLPFSAGPRNCLGQKFAIMEEKVALAFILRRYRVISMLSEEENRALPEVSLKPSRGFPDRASGEAMLEACSLTRSCKNRPVSPT
ncbi:Cytochrome P450 4C1 [Toxocara canis]|uniref:Cytochrome P450 4C1 n=1 Tax=Toxocara canis TaxID=6265 RepID=A0A0B2VMS6_TOXCA|nr:Cytochrome P450 4C1 [Toxocara canis]